MAERDAWIGPYCDWRNALDPGDATGERGFEAGYRAGEIAALGKVLAIVEGGQMRGGISGALKADCQDHHLRFLPSLTKRVAGQVMATIRAGLGVGKAPTFDPWKAHCNTCRCPDLSRHRVALATTEKTDGK